MKIKEFVDLLIDRGFKEFDPSETNYKTIISGKKGFNIMVYEKIKEKTNEVDFKCDFESCSKRNGPMCCCKKCLNATGYLNVIHKKDLYEYARRFNNKTGFWRENKGCILPRRLRSYICLRVKCFSSICYSNRENAILYLCHHDTFDIAFRNFYISMPLPYYHYPNILELIAEKLIEIEVEVDRKRKETINEINK